MPDDDRDLAQRLRAYESRLPDADAPDPRAIRRRRGGSPGRPIVLGGGAGAVAAVGVAVALLLSANPSGIDPGAIGSPSGAAVTAAPTGTKARTAVESASATPTQPPTPTPASTLGQSNGWSAHPVAPTGVAVSLGRIAELREDLYAFGNDGQGLAIFVSSDGLSWTASSVPPFDNPEVSGSVGSVVDAGERLVALAVHGAPGGSGPVGTVIYVSDDGRVWTEVDPAGDVPPLSAVAVVGDRLVAAGRGVWISDDRGLTWAESKTYEDMGGGVFSLAVHGDLLIGAGQVGYDIIGPSPTALVWVSRDRGLTWERYELSDEAGAWAAATSSSGRLVIVGGAIWLSDDEGRSWRQLPSPVSGCCVTQITTTPTGFVGAGLTEDGGRILLSEDGDDWHAEALPFEPRDIAWGPTFGLVSVSDNAVLFGPEPAP